MAFIRSGGFRILLAAVVVLSFAAGAAGVGFYVSFLRDLPDLHRIEDFRPALSSLVLDSRGVPIGEFYTERRSLVPLESIPEHTRMAFVAAEDSNFFKHAGIDYVAILRAAWVDLRAGRIEQGASTITMQLVKQMLLSPEKKFRRKFREMILARKIEATFSKDEILYLYLNQIYFGHGAWGIGQAARSYFGKEVSELSISESALLAGLPQRPSEYSPFRDSEAAEKRRRHVLKRLREDQYIDEAQYAEAVETLPALVGDIREPDYEAAGYFTEEVRRYLFDLLGGKRVLEGGLVIETTLHLDLQKLAVENVRAGLQAHDRRQGYRGPLRRVAEENIAAEIELLAEANQLTPDEEDLPPEGPSEEPLVAEANQLEPDEDGFPPEGPSEEPLLEPDEDGFPPEVPSDRPLLGMVTSVDAKANTAQVSFAPQVEGRVYLADVDWARQPNPKRRGARRGRGSSARGRPPGPAPGARRPGLAARLRGGLGQRPGPGGGEGLPGQRVQPRHPGPAAARLGLQAPHLRGGAVPELHPGLDHLRSPGGDQGRGVRLRVAPPELRPSLLRPPAPEKGAGEVGQQRHGAPVSRRGGGLRDRLRPPPGHPVAAASRCWS